MPSWIAIGPGPNMNSCQFWAVHGSYWQFLAFSEVLGSSWHFLAVLGSSWQSLAVLGSSWIFLVVLGSFLQFLAILGSSCQMLGVLGSSRQFLVVLHDSSWKFFAVLQFWAVFGSSWQFLAVLSNSWWKMFNPCRWLLLLFVPVNCYRFSCHVTSLYRICNKTTTAPTTTKSFIRPLVEMILKKRGWWKNIPLIWPNAHWERSA